MYSVTRVLRSRHAEMDDVQPLSPNATNDKKPNKGKEKRVIKRKLSQEDAEKAEQDIGGLRASVESLLDVEDVFSVLNALIYSSDKDNVEEHEARFLDALETIVPIAVELAFNSNGRNLRQLHDYTIASTIATGFLQHHAHAMTPNQFPSHMHIPSGAVRARFPYR
jgi:hypothetical protein